MRHLRLSAVLCIILYALVGFIAGVCPSLPDKTAAHHHHHKPATHAFACAWACHAGVGQLAVDPLSPVLFMWLIAILRDFLAQRIGRPRLIAISARPPPFLSA